MHSLMFLNFFSTIFSERSESYQHLYNFKRIPELLSDPFNKSHFFNENLKTRSHTYLTPQIGRQGDLWINKYQFLTKIKTSFYFPLILYVIIMIILNWWRQ